jgi:DNA polymerase I-like protein with 3'-5' exonuclease and polymerase domains
LIDLTRYHAVAIDTETTGLHWPRDEMFGFSVTVPGWSEYYDIRERPDALLWLQDQARKFQGTWILFNATFDIKMLHSKGVHIPVHQVEDTSINAALIDEHLPSHSLDFLGRKYLGAKKVDEIYGELAAIFGGRATKNVQMPNLHRAPPEIVAPYAIRDTELTYALWEWQQKEIDRQGIRDIVDFEHRVLPYVLKQEMAGIRVDIQQAKIAQDKLHVIIDREYNILRKEVGGDMNVNSTPQIKAYYDPHQNADGDWVLRNGLICGTTEKGNPSINNDVLQAMREKDVVADQIIKLRSLIRTADTFLGGHILGHEINGRVYPTINQVARDTGGTKTGRFSYTDPAMQQIPNRNKEVAALVKPCFLPDPGHVWVDADLNSFEVRTFAHLVAAYNQTISDAYRKDPHTDFHRWVAGLMRVPRNPQPNGGPNAKQINLSMIFNSGNGSIAEQLGYPTFPDQFLGDDGKIVKYRKASPEAMKVINDYHRKVQGVKTLAERCKKKALKRGYIKTKYGRRLRFPNHLKSKAYKASGILIQATAADINKENWMIVDDAIGDRGRMLLNTHDSYSMSMEKDTWKGAWKDVKAAVEKRDWMRVPLILDFNGMGTNWWEALQGG